MARDRLRRCCSCRCRRSRGAPAAAHARATASMTACFSSASSAVASPVVPSATMPLTPAARYSSHSRSIASTSTAPVASNGVISGTQTPRRSRSLVMRTSVLVEPRRVPEGIAGPRVRSPPCRCGSRSRSRCSSASRPACCRGCSASAARSSRRPRSGLLGATALAGDRLDPAVDPAVVDLGIAALPPRELDPAARRGARPSAFGVPGVGRRLAPVRRGARQRPRC